MLKICFFAVSSRDAAANGLVAVKVLFLYKLRRLRSTSNAPTIDDKINSRWQRGNIQRVPISGKGIRAAEGIENGKGHGRTLNI
jgi:hypothetical protein